jgi:hypothetical protein
MAKNKQQAKKMAAKGKPAAQIKAKTGVGSQTANMLITKKAPTPKVPKTPTPQAQTQPAAPVYRNSAGHVVQMHAPNESDLSAHDQRNLINLTRQIGREPTWVPGLMEPGMAGYNVRTGGGNHVWQVGEVDPEQLRAYYRDGSVGTDRALDGKNRADFTLDSLFSAEQTPAQQTTSSTAMGKTKEKNKNKELGIKQVIKQSGPKISQKEMNQIVKAAGGNVGTAINRIASVQSSMKQAGKTAPSVGSSAANMFIKQAQSNPALAYQLGSSKLGQTLRSMIGTPAGPMIQGQQRAAQPGTGLMIGGTVIKPGGGISVYRQPQGAAPAVGDTVAAGPYDGMMDGPTEGSAGGGDSFDFQSMLDSMTAAQQPQFDMSPLTDMFNTQFDQLSSQFDMMDPLQLAQLGQAYGGDAIRARQRARRTRGDYRRGLPSMLGSVAPTLASMGIGGGLTL